MNIFNLDPNSQNFLKEKIYKKFYNSFSKICKNKNIKLIINNDFEIATDFFFDGIHLGQNDKSCRDAKEKFGRDFIVGISCSNSYYLYQVAKKDKADYVAFGPTFKSKTKEKETISLLELIKFKKN